MADTICTITAMLSPKLLNTAPPGTSTKPPAPKPISLVVSKFQILLPKLTPSSRPSSETSIPSLAATAITFSALGASGPATAAQELAAIAAAEGSDNRGLALLLPIIPAIAWVLFNILQPALNQINRMRNK